MSRSAAILATLLVPGSAHLALGHVLRGLVALISTLGLFWAGVSVLGERIWYFQLFEPFALIKPLLDLVPLQLLPESPNLGCSIALTFTHGAPSGGQELFDWLRLIRVPVVGEHLGLMLTGGSGIVAALWAADAHWLSQQHPPARTAPALAAGLSWLLPGSGHWLLGQRGKGVLIGSAVLLMFGGGLALSEGHAVDRTLRSAWWIGEVLCGGGTLAASLTTAPLEEGYPPRFIDHGVAMCTVAGFMNLIVMIDAFTVAEGEVLGSGEVAAAEGAA
ncbi:MAG: DUF6677 family protein [Planctomycetota bacterium]